VGLIPLFATQQTQRLGDLAARTVVIREQEQVSLQNIKEIYAVRYALITRNEEIPSYIDIDRLSESDRRLIVDYLQRRMNLGRREHLVMPLAKKIADLMGMTYDAPLQTPVAAEKFVEQVARAFELRDIEAQENA
jgi:plasmid stabilization system protein ParE